MKRAGWLLVTLAAAVSAQQPPGVVTDTEYKADPKR